MKKIEQFNKRQDSIEKRKREKQIELRRTISEKILQHHKKEEFVVKQKTQYEIFKEEYNSKLKQKFNTVEEKVNNFWNLIKFQFNFYGCFKVICIG